MPVNGIGLLAAAGGGLLLYSAVQGKGFGSAVRAILAGESPANAQNVNPITIPAGPGVTADLPSGSLFPGDTGAGTGVTVTAPASGSEKAFIVALLTSMGAPSTDANIQSLSAWFAREGPWGTQGENGNNPLNTSITGLPGYEGKWSLAPVVSIYATASDGIGATVATLKDYPEIMAALRSGKGLCGNESVAGELSTWSGGGYSQVC
jgi:hypothetical protein